MAQASSGQAVGAVPGDKPEVRVLIVGGGCAGVSAAWHLSELNASADHPARYRITLCESAPRLGGKGASTRDERGRILEHGLHIWLGFYENAFRMMRRCYDEVASVDDLGPLMHRHFDEAFFPEPQIGLAESRAGDEWLAWTGWFPPMPGLPGDPLVEGSNPFTLAGYLRRSLGLLKMLMQSEIAPPKGQGAGRSSLDEALDVGSSFDLRESPSVLVERLFALWRTGSLATVAGWLQAVTMLDVLLQQEAALPLANLRLLKFIHAWAAQSRKLLAGVAAIDPDLRRKTEIIDLTLTIVVGLLRDKVLLDPRGLDALNGIDCREWLRRHGATKTSLDSPFVLGLYDLAFAYPQGDRKRPQLAAGQALRGALRMFFTYRGAMFWRMRSGMGETVFSPLYRVLRRRGVEFRFQHNLRRADFEDDGDRLRLSTLHFEVPGDPDAVAARDPLDALGCWPHAPFDGGLRTPWIRRDTVDFDAVIMATGPLVLKATCGELLRRRPRWKRMCEDVRTVATRAAQFWLRPTLAELGWKRGPVVLSGFKPPFDTWADMTHALGSEARWRDRSGLTASSEAATLAYFCAVAPDDATPQSVRDHDAREFLERHAKALWPELSRRKAWLVGRDGKAKPGWAALGEQHFCANTQGSDRYTLSLPGTLESRISPLDDTVSNMTIAGDWTDCGFNEGCIEAATMSGMLACHAIAGAPDLEGIVGYHHP